MFRGPFVIRVLDDLLELGATLGETRDGFLALLVLGDLRLLAMD
jgi:hypothetical protein